MYRNPTEPQPESAVSPWMASILMRRGGSAWQRFALTYHQLSAMPRRWRRQLRRKAAVGLGSAALILALAGPIVAAPVFQPAAPDATIVVVNGEVANVNNNKCGLIEAILNARTTSAGGMRPDCAAGNPNGADTVSLPANGTFVLTAAHNAQFGETGLPVITSAVTIEGHGATIRRSTASGTPNFRILAVDPNGALTLRDTNISNGRLYQFNYYYGGGGILSLGALTLSGATIANNTTDGYDSQGGGIQADGATTITTSVITQNEATADNFTNGGGLKIGRNGHATITGSTISHNMVYGYYGSSGGGIAVSGEATIIDSDIAYNLNKGSETGGEGGGIYVSGQATITGSTLRANVADSFYEGGGGGLWPGVGGGLANSGTTLVVNSTISGNSANAGGGLANFWHSDLTVVHSTVSGNRGRQDVTHPYEDDITIGGYGGGIFSGSVYHNPNCAATTLQGVIVSGNTADVSAPQVLFSPTGGCDDWGYQDATFTVDANNVFGQNNNAGLSGLTKGASDIVPTVGLAAILSPLANNGGPTMTHALPANSPALDRAPNASCTAAPVNGIDQRGEARNQNAVDGATNNECDVGAYERAGSAAAMGFYLSATNNGTVGGVPFAPGDIIKFTPGGGWAMHFDASDVGITKNVAAFEIEANGHILLSLVAPQTVPGAGNVAAQDVIRFTPTSTGNNTAGSFAMALDGSANLLTTSGEKIDALGLTGNGRLALSTSGAAAVKRPDNSVLKAQDEDVLGFNLGNGQWSEVFDGTTVPGLKAEDVNALWIDPATGDLYISIVGAFNLGGIAGDGRDIVKLTPSGAPGGYTPSLVWDGSANGFPTNIDGLEMIP